MSETAKRIAESLQELLRFVRGEPGIMAVSVPDGRGGVKRRLVRNVGELIEAQKEEVDGRTG